MKRCSRCGIEKELSEFYKKNTAADGKQSHCRDCESKSQKEQYAKHREERAAYRRAYQERNGKTLAAKKLEYYYANKEKCSECKKRSYNKYRDKNAKRRAKYYETNKDLVKSKNYQYRKTPEGRIVAHKNEHKRRSLMKDTERTLTLAQWQKIIDLQKNRCVLCGKLFTKKNPPTQDHIIPIIPYNGPFTRENTQAVHASCNSRKSNKLDKSNIVVWISALAQEV